MSTPIETLWQRTHELVGEKLCDAEMVLDQILLTVEANDLIAVCEVLRDHEDLKFTQLMDLCGVDFSTYGQADWKTGSATNTGFSRAVSRASLQNLESENRFAVVYQLLSIEHNLRVRVRTFLNSDSPVVPSVSEVWSAADWYEREAFDMYGILFTGHPDLRRLLTDYGFIGHPFRKDFPLEGNVEVRYDEKLGRVVYQPVSIENRTLVPRVIRHDSRYAGKGEHNA